MHVSGKSSIGDHYSRITKNVDKLISNHGSEKAADLIESIALVINPQTDTIDIQKLILSEIVKAFEINIKVFETNNFPIYKKARKSCFYLLHEYGKMSFALIKKKFKKFPHSRPMIAKLVNEMDAIIQLPRIDSEHHRIHMIIEETIIKYISKK